MTDTPKAKEQVEEQDEQQQEEEIEEFVPPKHTKGSIPPEHIHLLTNSGKMIIYVLSI